MFDIFSIISFAFKNKKCNYTEAQSTWRNTDCTC